MTKQGLRDLNHYGPRTKTAAPEATSPTENARPPVIAEAAALGGEATVVTEAPSVAPADAVRGDGGGVP